MADQVNGAGVGPHGQLVDVLCGPLLNYRRMSGEHTNKPSWHGSVLIVTSPGAVPRSLHVRSLGPVNSTGAPGASKSGSFPPTRLYEDAQKAFWQYSVEVPFEEQETTWEYTIADLRAAVPDRTTATKPMRFVVPSKHESMRIMFHSCNGFSIGTDVAAWNGPALWNDVLRIHEKQPFHVMIGGGDQIYNDSVRLDGPLNEWTLINNPKKRRDYHFDHDIRAKCDQYYFDNYCTWYSAAPFATANGQIAQLNIWDDHDIIDGFGSYTDHFMKCAVFRGIGSVAHKYYMLFQHHLAPSASTFTTGAPHTVKVEGVEGVPAGPKQLENTHIMKRTAEDPSYILGSHPGPYIQEPSRNLYCQLGKRIAFAGLDARTERTRHQINYPETYDLFFNHLSTKIGESQGTIKHLILLLGVPIAYPRLQWLEFILKSPLIGPVKFLNKRFGVAGSFFNTFDGSVDLIDDLDDHYTTHAHKKERKDLVMRLQQLSKQHNLRISILGGDVHLAAIGRFYSNPTLNIPAERDHRYMANIISSAITNHPPPAAVANLLARRNKIHHLDHETDETLLQIFDRQPGAGEAGVKPKGADVQLRYYAQSEFRYNSRITLRRCPRRTRRDVDEWRYSYSRSKWR